MARLFSHQGRLWLLRPLNRRMPGLAMGLLRPMELLPEFVALCLERWRHGCQLLTSWQHAHMAHAKSCVAEWITLRCKADAQPWSLTHARHDVAADEAEAQDPHTI